MMNDLTESPILSSTMPWIVANWKMHGMTPAVRELVTQIALNYSEIDSLVLCPPATALYQLGNTFLGTKVRLGAQDCHEEPEGAYTGDISAAMLRDVGCHYVILGHSERRHHHQEDDALIHRKIVAAYEAELVPILCVGEQASEREAGKAEEVVAAQLKACLPPQADSHNTLIAYEPVWAIGSGKTPRKEDITAMHRHIVACLQEMLHCNDTPQVLYGGSVKPHNASDILTTEGVDGVLVGGASLEPKAFAAIIDTMRNLHSARQPVA